MPLEPEHDTIEQHGADQAATAVRALLRHRSTWIAGAFIGVVVIAAVAAGMLRAQRPPERTSWGGAELSLQDAEKAASDQPSDLRARLALAYAYWRTARYEDCIRECNAVLDREPGSVAALLYRGKSYLRLGESRAGESDLWDVLELEPDHVQAAIALGEYYAERGHYRSLLVAVLPVVEKHPEVAALQYLAGLGYEHTGHEDWARARYRMALQLNPNMSQARAGLDRLE